MTTSESDIASNLGVVFEKLVNLVHELKQAAWSAPDSDRRHHLENLQAYLAEQAIAIDEEEKRVGGRPPWIVSPTGYNSPNLAAEAGGDSDRFLALLVDHLKVLIGDMRERGKVLPGGSGTLLAVMADRIERRVERLGQ
jgi:hypothetical protein